MKQSKKLIHYIISIGILIGIIFTTIFMLKKCSNVELRGLEKYGRANSSIGISRYLLPVMDGEKNEILFLKAYPYIDGDYFYFETGVFTDRCVEQELMYLVYSPDVYEEAKNEALEDFSLSSCHRYRYNGYDFIENLSNWQMEYATLTKYNQKGYEYFIETGENLYFPNNKFNMVAYNDEKNILLFLGFHFGGKMNEEDEIALNPFQIEAFLKTYFYFYDFNQ